MITTPPAVKPPVDWRFPTPTEHTLSNGIKVLVHDRPGQQVATALLILPVPLSVEPRELEGIGVITSACLDEGTEELPGSRFAEVLETEGTQLWAHHMLAGLEVGVDASLSQLPTSLKLMAQAVSRPSLNESDVTRHVALRLDELEQIKAHSSQLAGVKFREAVYAEQSRPHRMNGGTEASLPNITVDAVRDFHHRWYGPQDATLVLAGDFSGLDPIAVAEDAFGSWDAPGQQRADHQPLQPASPQAILVDRPGSVQADIRLGGFGIDRHDPRWPAIQVAVYSVGGAFWSRLNRVLREERGWTYGTGLTNAPLRQGGAFHVHGSFRTEVLADAVAEATRLITDIEQNPITAAEVETALSFFGGVSPVRYSTAEAVADQAASQVLQGLSTTWLNDYLAGIRAVTPEAATRAYAEIVRPEQLSLVVVGDGAQLADPLRAAGWAV